MIASFQVTERDFAAHLPELASVLPLRIPSMNLPELAAAVPALGGFEETNAAIANAWARLAELAANLEAEGLELALGAAMALHATPTTPSVSSSCSLAFLEQIDVAESPKPMLKAQFLVLAWRCEADEADLEDGLQRPEREGRLDERLERLAAVSEGVGSQLAAADLQSLPWAMASELLRAIAHRNIRGEAPWVVPGGLIAGLVEVLFTEESHALSEVAEVLFALAQLGANLQSVASHCDLAAKLAVEPLEPEALVRLAWAMAGLDDAVAWQLCNERLDRLPKEASEGQKELLAEAQSRRKQSQEEWRDRELRDREQARRRSTPSQPRATEKAPRLHVSHIHLLDCYAALLS